MSHADLSLREIGVSAGQTGAHQQQLFTFIYSLGLQATVTDSLPRRITQIAGVLAQPIPLLIRSFVGNIFRQRERKFMGFLHEITRKHNPCPLRWMSPRLRRLHFFRSPLLPPFPAIPLLSSLSFRVFYPRASARPIVLQNLRRRFCEKIVETYFYKLRIASEHDAEIIDYAGRIIVGVT